MMRKLLFLIVAFSSFGAILTRANVIYVAQSAAGSHSGASCADARAYTSLAGGDWVAGNTIHLCGTFSMGAGASGTITIGGSGSSGNPITILFENGANATAPYWGVNGFIYAANVNWITVDGGVNGSITATANGTGLANQVSQSSGVKFVKTSNLEVKNLSITNIYVHNCVYPVSTCTDHIGYYSSGIAVNDGNNVTIDHNTIHDVYAGVNYFFDNAAGNPWSNLSVHDNDVGNCNWCITTSTGSYANATLNGDLIYNNTVHDWGKWDRYCPMAP
jgi:hypothetical protein